MSKILIALEIYLNVYKYVILNILTPIHFIFSKLSGIYWIRLVFCRAMLTAR